MRTMRSRRGKSARTPSVGEIKQAICNHERLGPVRPSEQRTVGGDWRTKMTCPACGAWYIRTTADAAIPTPVAGEHEPSATLAVVPS